MLVFCHPEDRETSIVAERFEKTGLWNRTLGLRRKDEDHESREILRRAYLDMRKGAKFLTEQIQNDCPELTVHNVTHLDALWETADTLLGPDFPVNPSEAFVFGAAVLLHDAAMSLASYAGGVAEVATTSEWSDAVAELADSYARAHPDDVELRGAPAAIRGRVIFTVLRQLHAKRAEGLLDLKLARPGKDEALGLLSNIELKDAFGHSIGKVAHSHHWDIRDIPDNLVTKVGAAIELPPNWTVNEIKVACMLRCADAAHLDARRAPTFLYALLRPSGISEVHWNFQNKLNQMALDGTKVVFSGSPFGQSEADAWWLAYENAVMVDREIRNSNALLEDIGCPPFHVSGVAGIESPTMFSKKVRVVGWEPVEAEVRVSDPVHLAKTIGGENLYGGDKLAPLRELIQNAVDAIRARRGQDNLDPTWGKVAVELLTDDEGTRWLNVEDNGIGMSQRVLTGPLIDFGNSFWNSALASEEFPGLRSKRVRTAGKFGIGFFSVFLLGEHVKVISKRYDAARKEARVLEFARLSKRPLIRPANEGDLAKEASTRVTVQLTTDAFFKPGGSARGAYGPPSYQPSLAERLRRMIVGLDVNVDLTIDGKCVWSHAADWVHTDSETFLCELFATEGPSERDQFVATYKDRLRPILEADGEVVGRAAIEVGPHRRLHASGCAISVDGFCGGRPRDREVRLFQEETTAPAGLTGVLLGETSDASRKDAEVQVSQDALARWATEQGKLIDKARFKPGQLMDISSRIMRLGGDPLDLPCVFRAGRFENFAEFKSFVESSSELIVPLYVPYGEKFRVTDLHKAGSDFFLLRSHASVIIFQTNESHAEILSDKEARAITEDRKNTLSTQQVGFFLERHAPFWLTATLRAAWPHGIGGRIAGYQLFDGDLFAPPGLHWGLRLLRETP